MGRHIVSPTVVKTRTMVTPAQKKRSKKSKRGLLIAIVAGAYLIGHAGAASPSTPSHECKSWAAMIEAPAGDYRMQMIGCDEQADGSYIREDGQCAFTARHMWRDYHNLYLIEQQVSYFYPTCELFEDGSWSN